jgi:cold shock CspA family protein
VGKEDRQSGIVVRVFPDKGFGFIRDQKGTEYFFHRTACREWDTLKMHQSVTFMVQDNPKGPRAEDIAALS